MGRRAGSDGRSEKDLTQRAQRKEEKGGEKSRKAERAGHSFREECQLQVSRLEILSPIFSSFLCVLCVKAFEFEFTFAFRRRSISQVTIVG
jgi:hypothetical protein